MTVGLALAAIMGQLSVLTLILGGLISSALFASLLSLVKYLADPEDQLPAIVYWLLGSLAQCGWGELIRLALPLLPGVLLLCAAGRLLDVLSISDDEALSLGVPVRQLRLLLIVLATLVSALTVSVAGIIGWLGLLVPHLARLLVGASNTRLLPLSALLGASLLVLADTCARSLSAGEIPLGVVTELVGALAFALAQRQILAGVSFALKGGEVVSLLGINGAGKSSLLRILLGLLKPDAGEVLLQGRPLSHWKPSVRARVMAYVPQNHAGQFPYQVAQVVAMGRIPYTGLSRGLREEDRRIIEMAMARMQISALAERDYSRLSGGERQRVLLARALAQEAQLLVLDEPMSGLDFGQQHRLYALLLELAAEGTTVLSSTHRPDEVLQYAHRALLLANGRLVADGPPQQIIHATSMSTLYDVPLRQFDVAGRRFFGGDSN
ncbi:fe3+-siderophore abc transporter atp-binding protein [Lasius niger]|uniref:Fe3+-siderophore abc transporter atp-binding protein n=1 Tax=Lasius niger TaxID=67767 RepID=A0A0J7K6D0_LASNI|nr:fe3+-siderophore abc transporter atp-binding protein [Lasius niger]